MAGLPPNSPRDDDLPPDEVEAEDSEATNVDEPLIDEAPAEGNLVAGSAVIRAAMKTAPKGPGVYRMLDAQGHVLYVGKAKSIVKRIASYTRPTGLVARIAGMVSLTAAMEFVSTKSEMEALLLEANLIKQLRPRFNVLLRDDKSFPYILITRDHASPQLTKHRGARNRKGDFFGPFASAQAVNTTLNALQRAFLLRSCTDAYFEARTRPCLLFQIKRCAGPCTQEISPDGYDTLVREARAFLSGRSHVIKEQLAQQMDAAAAELEFERAAMLRDRLAALSSVQSSQSINPRFVEEADVFAIAQDGGQNCVEVFFFRTGQNWGNRAYFPRADKSLEAGEVLAAFIAQFYDDKPVPSTVLVSHGLPDQDLLAEALGSHARRAVEIIHPKRGEKRDLIDHAVQNAREALGRRLAETATQGRLIDALAQVLRMPKPPQRIELYDNSHISGAHAVGAMVVAGPEGLRKKDYRTFNIRNEALAPGDDFGMMREVLTRRFKRLLATQEPRQPVDDPLEAQWPDLLIIDGGKGQVDAVTEVLDSLGVAGVAVVGVAKGRDRDAGREVLVMPGREPFRLEPRDPVLYFIQRLRDEVHRFAIGTHRAKRSKAISEAGLSEIGGIGPARKRALLRHFGTLKAIEQATVEDLAKVEGVSHATARAIHDFFHPHR